MEIRGKNLSRFNCVKFELPLMNVVCEPVAVDPSTVCSQTIQSRSPHGLTGVRYIYRERDRGGGSRMGAELVDALSQVDMAVSYWHRSRGVTEQTRAIGRFFFPISKMQSLSFIYSSF